MPIYLGPTKKPRMPRHPRLKQFLGGAAYFITALTVALPLRFSHNDWEKIEGYHLEGGIPMGSLSIDHQRIKCTSEEFLAEGIQRFVCPIPSGFDFDRNNLIPMSQEKVDFIMFFQILPGRPCIIVQRPSSYSYHLGSKIFKNISKIYTLPTSRPLSAEDEGRRSQDRSYGRRA